MTRPHAPIFDDPDATPEDMASQWIARKRSGRMTVDEGEHFERWLSRDPENRAAYDTLEEFWHVIDLVRSDPTIIGMREDARRWLSLPPRRTVYAAIAASFAALVVGAVLLMATGVVPNVFARPVTQEYQTAIGKTQTVTLADGSIVTLDTDTVLRSVQTRRYRRIELDRGQAFFRVAKDPSRPFMVIASGKTVTATGTAFEVRIDPKRFEVAVVEGEVIVEASLAPARGGLKRYVQTAEVRAGSRLVAAGDARWKVTPIDVAKETGWLYGQLIVVREPLGDVAAEMNRYSRKKIVIIDPRVAQKTISGSFTTGAVDDFVLAVETYKLARVRGETASEVQLGSR
jgi:transmembrane sensor